MDNTFNPGIPVTADAAAIEQELRSLWESASQDGANTALIRACAGNLITLAAGRDAAGHLLGVLPGVAQQHPLRSLVAFWSRGEAVPGLSRDVPLGAWISAQCSVPVAGGPQVCSEVITLAAVEGTEETVTNLLASILIPDLPVYIYLPCFTSALAGVAGRLADWTNLLILDSRNSGYRTTGQEGLLQLLSSPPGGIPVRDLQWSRLTAWRDLVSQFFDAPERRSLPYLISDVEITAARPDPAAIPSASLLLAGWLASRLAWVARSAGQEQGRLVIRFDTDNGEAAASLLAASAETDHVPLESVVLRTRTGQSFSVRLDRPSSCLTSGGAVDNNTEVRHTVPDEEWDEANLLVKELSIAGEDPGFQEALKQAITITAMLG